MNEKQLYYLIDSIGSLLRVEIKKAGNEIGLQPVHLQILNYLSLCNRFSNTPASVSEYIGATRGTVSQTLQRLVIKGYLHQKTDECDRRVQHFEVSESGQQILTKLISPPNFHHAVHMLDKTSQGIIITALTQLLGNLQTTNQAKSYGVCKDCRFLKVDNEYYQCGLAREPLHAFEINRICRSFAPKN